MKYLIDNKKQLNKTDNPPGYKISQVEWMQRTSLKEHRPGCCFLITSPSLSLPLKSSLPSPSLKWSPHHFTFLTSLTHSLAHSLTIIIILIKALQYLQCVSSPWYFNIHQSTALRSIKRTSQSRTIICGLTKVLNSKEAFSSDILNIEWVCWSKFISLKLKLQNLDRT